MMYYKLLRNSFDIIVLLSLSVLGAISFQKSSEGMVLKFSAPQFTIKKKWIDGEPCSYISIVHAEKLIRRGYPELPLFTENIAIDAASKTGVEIVDIAYRDYTVGKMVPSKGHLNRTINPGTISYTFGEIYSKNSWYPETAVKLGKPYIIRDLRGVTVLFTPFQYNPVLGKLRVAESVTVRITGNQYTAVSPLTRIQQGSAAFHTLYKNQFINYTQSSPTGSSTLSDGDNMVIIIPSEFREVVEPLAVWKNQKGIATTIYEYPTQTRGVGAPALQSFIQEQYTDNGTAYFLLVGDIAMIPARYTEAFFDDEAGYMDYSYALLSGNDFYADAIVGRLSVEDSTEARVFVNKILSYEKQPDSTGSWYHKATGIASDEAADIDGKTDFMWMDEFRDTLLGHTFTLVDQIYDPGALSSDVSAAINEGRSWINYMGHGDAFSWSTSSFMSSHVSALTNSNMLPVVYSVACLNGMIDNVTSCFAELWTRKENGGAVAFVGSSTSMPWIPPQYSQQETIRLLANNSCQSLGALVYNGIISMLDFAEDAPDTDDVFNTTALAWILFGDPSLMVYTDTPQKMQVSSPVLDTGTQTVTVSFGEAIDGRLCFYSSTNGILASQIVVNSSSAALPITIQNDHTVLLTVTAVNKMPYQEELTVVNSSIKNNLVPKALSQEILIKKSARHYMVMIRVPGILTVSIYDIKGRTLFSTQTDNTQKWYAIPVSLSSGLHLLSVKNNGRNFTKKFYVNR